MTIVKTTAAAFAKAVGIYKSGTATAADLAAQIAELDAGDDTRSAALAAADAARRAAVLSGDAPSIAKAEAALATARLQVDHAQIVREGLQDRLASQEAAEALVRRKAAHAAARGAQKSAIALARDVLPRMAEEAERLLEAMKLAQAAIEAANADLPDGAEPIVDPEMVLFGSPAIPGKVLSEREVEAWVWPSSGRRVAEDAQIRVDENNPKRGWVYQRGHGEHPIERRTFKVTRELPHERQTWPAFVLANALRIPAIEQPRGDDRRPVESWAEINPSPPAFAA